MHWILNINQRERMKELNILREMRGVLGSYPQQRYLVIIMLNINQYEINT